MWEGEGKRGRNSRPWEQGRKTVPRSNICDSSSVLSPICYIDGNSFSYDVSCISEASRPPTFFSSWIKIKIGTITIEPLLEKQT